MGSCRHNSYYAAAEHQAWRWFRLLLWLLRAVEFTTRIDADGFANCPANWWSRFRGPAIRSL
ncbi:MAG: hypothetical protein WB036_20980, partial [Pseudolabrys sp.]